MRRLLELDGGLYLSVSATTREARPGETDGVDYHFVSEEEYRGMVERGEFLEHAEVFGRLYGTPRSEIDAARAQGRDLLMEIDVQGADQVRAVLPKAVSVFVVSETREELERRLRGRNTETDEAVERRLQVAEAEVDARSKYTYIVINDEVEAAARRLLSIVVAERCRPERTGALSRWKRMTSRF